MQFSQRTGHPSPGRSVLWEILTIRDGHEANRLHGSEVAAKAGVFGGAEMEGLESALLWRVD